MCKEQGAKELIATYIEAIGYNLLYLHGSIQKKMGLDYTVRKIGDGDLARIRISFYFQDQDQWRQYYEENLRG